MDKRRARKLEKIFSETLFKLQECYEEMDAPIFTVTSGLGYDYEMESRRKLIELCKQIAAKYSKSQTEGMK